MMRDGEGLAGAARLERVCPAWAGRWGSSVAVLLVALVFLAAWFISRSVYLVLAGLPDAVIRPAPFPDLYSILLAGQCWAQGTDVYLPSPCLGGTFNYSPLMLRVFAWSHLTPADTLAGGAVLLAGYALALGWMKPARTWRELALRTAVCASPTAWFALEQANFDVLLFIASAGAFWLLGRAWRWRRWAYAIFLGGFVMKFYPAALLVLACRERRGRFILLTLVSLAVALWFYLSFYMTFTHSKILLDFTEPFENTFGAANLPAGLMILRWLSIDPNLFHHGYGPAHFLPNPWLMRGLLAGAVGVSLVTRRGAMEALAALEPGERLYLLGGAVLICFCFFAAQNVSYRAIYMGFLMPGLWRLVGRGQVHRLAVVAVVLLQWEALVRDGLQLLGHWLLHNDSLEAMFWLVRELVWWGVAVYLLRLVLAYVLPNLLRLWRGEIDASGGAA